MVFVLMCLSFGYVEVRGNVCNKFWPISNRKGAHRYEHEGTRVSNLIVLSIVRIPEKLPYTDDGVRFTKDIL